ncbi:MAG TPA: DivIVA domain-containing protein [Candidatus Limnocylindria bacterium]|jgi:cell division initiation protein|nr:DivIVA domain-containing protein [Candidatus Limnocylindria bacterium]
MAKITVVDIQHKTFKKALQGYERTEVDQFLDEIIETLEDEAQMRAALEAEVSDLKERISHFKAMEESLQSTLLLAQRTADEVKAAAHKEADLIRQEARLAAEREIAALGDRIDESRREAQRARDTAEKAKSELRSLLMSHLSLIDRGPVTVPPPAEAAAPAATPAPAAPPPPAAPASPTPQSLDARPTIKSETDELAQLPFNGAVQRRIVE